MSRPRGRALGRGLEALIPIGPEGTAGVVGANGIPEYIDVDQVLPSPGQMRKQLPGEALRELADSIRQHGIIQPILVRRLPEGYELIAGERRWRAARMAGLERIPAAQKTSLLDMHPIKRLGAPDDVANAAVFLASEQAGYITGTVLNVSGGLYT